MKIQYYYIVIHLSGWLSLLYNYHYWDILKVYFPNHFSLDIQILIWITFNWDWIQSHQSCTNVCTCYGSCAVIACAKYCTDLMITMTITAQNFFWELESKSNRIVLVRNGLPVSLPFCVCWAEKWGELLPHLAASDLIGRAFCHHMSH